MLVQTVRDVGGWLNARSAEGELRQVEASIRQSGRAAIDPAELRRIAGIHELAGWQVTDRAESGTGRLSAAVSVEGAGRRYLSWDAPRLGDQAMATFAPTRVPIILGAVAAVATLLIQVLRLSAALGREREAARTAARRDALSGLGNRLAFDEALAAVAAGDDTHLLLVDLDGFKQVNDRHGHAAGDSVLQAVGFRLSQIAAGEHQVFRLGGDEFALLTGGGAGRAHVLGLARQVSTLLAAPVDIGDVRVGVGASVGVASVDGTAGDLRQLLRQADAALYGAKQDRESGIRFAPDARGHDALAATLAA